MARGRTAEPPLWVDGYIRVSRVGQRKGERFISPTAQRDAIEAWARRTHRRIGEMFEELDESGGTFERPMLRRAIERIEQGISTGVVVDHVDRFGRSEWRGLLAIQQIQAVDGTVFAVHGGLDSSTDAGRLLLRNMLSHAEFELDRRRAAWETARRYAIARGVHQGATAPLGYRKTRSGRLRPRPDTGPIVTELFRRRAAGESVTLLARWLESEGVLTAYGNPGWAQSTLAKVLTNPVYLGRVQSGAMIREKAHPPLTDPITWQLAQSPRHPASGYLRRHSLLAGLVRCSGCGRILSIAGPDGAKYDCRVHHPAGRCPAPAHIAGSLLEPLVVAAVMRLLAERRSRPVVRLEAARQAIEVAEATLATYRDSDRVLRTLGPDAYAAGLSVRIDRLRRARLDLAAAQARDAAHDLPTRAEIQARWPSMDTAERREVIRAVLDCVFVDRGRGRPEERVTVFPVGTAPPDLPTRYGKRTPIRPLRGYPVAADAASVTAIDPWVLRKRLWLFTRGLTTWPDPGEFRAKGRAGLYRQAAFQGGERYWALQLGLIYPPGKKPRGDPWSEERIRASLPLILTGRTFWPSTKEFRELGLAELNHAAARTGGADRWTKEFPLHVRVRPSGFWTEQRIRETMIEFCRGRDRFPTHTDFKRANLGGLLAALYQTHSVQVWADTLGLARATRTRAATGADKDPPR